MKKIFIIVLLFCAFLQLFAEEDDKLKLAVMEFEDRSGNLSEKTLSDATEYIRGAFLSTNKYVVIAKERQEKAMIAQMKKESYKLCNDKNCQIPLGQALSADTILRTTITFFGGVYTITSELIDLAKEASVVGTKQDYDGSEAALKHALDEIAEKIAAYAERIETDGKSQENQEVNHVAAEERPAAEKSLTAEENPEKKAAGSAGEATASSEEPLPENTGNNNTYHPYKTAGISLMVAGAAIAVAGVAGFHVASDKEFDKYKNMRNDGTASDAVSEGLTHDQYMDRARKHKDKSNTYRILEITSGALGGAVLVTGIILTAIKKEKQEAKVALSNVSLTPSGDGFYAALGFEF